MLARAGCSNVEALNVDFLTTDVSDEKYAHVTHMYVRSVHTLPVVSHPFDENSLLDPSCSGSGIINRLDHLVESGTFCRLYGLRTGGGSLTSLISPPWYRQEAEGSSVAHSERLTKLATFQLQMLRHAMKCICPPPFFSCYTQSYCQF